MIDANWRERLERILHEPIYHNRAQDTSIWTFIGNWVKRWWASLHLDPRLNLPAPTWIAGATVILGLLLWWLTRALSHDRPVPSRLRSDATRTASHPVIDPLTEADACARNANWHDAAHFYFAAVVARLHDDYQLPCDPAMTTGDYARAVRRINPSLAQRLTRIGALCDRVWYAQRCEDAARGDAVLQLQRCVRELLLEGGESP